MSTQTSDNNKRIAKNTLLLYVRMLFMMVVSLYRAVLCREYFRDYEIDNYDGTTIQRITESLYKGGFGKFDKD